MKKLFIVLFAIISGIVHGQNFTADWDFPNGIPGFINKPCYIAGLKVLGKSGDAREPEIMCNSFINNWNRQNSKKIRTIKYFYSDMELDVENQEFNAMADYVYLNYNMTIGEQYAIILFISDYPGPERNAKVIGSVFARVLTMKPYDGCIVLPIAYTDYGSGIQYYGLIK